MLEQFIIGAMFGGCVVLFVIALFTPSSNVSRQRGENAED